MFPWPSIAAAALAAAWLSVIGLQSGGLAVVVCALAVALLVGTPMARVAQRDDAPAIARHMARGVKMVAAVSVLGGVLSMTPLSGPLRAMIAASVWMVASVVGPRPWARVAALVLPAVAMAGVFGLGHWTLLEPFWAGDWLSSSVVLGLLLVSAAGTGWSGTSQRKHHPAWALGLAGLALLGMSLLMARAWEVDAGPWVSLCALGLGLTGVIGSTEGVEHRLLAVPGAVLAACLALVPTEAAIAATHTLFPVSAAVFFAVLAWSGKGTARWTAVACTVACVVTAWAAWPGLPSTVTASIALSLVPVALVWTVGSVGLQPRGAA